MENERMKAIKDILKDSDRLLDLGDIEGHKEKLDELSMHGHLSYMINTIADQQATIDSLSMAHDAIHREMPKDKHTLIKNIIGLNKRVQELENENDILNQSLADVTGASGFMIKQAEEQNQRYREAIKKGINATRYTNPEVAYILGEALEGEE